MDGSLVAVAEGFGSTIRDTTSALDLDFFPIFDAGPILSFNLMPAVGALGVAGGGSCCVRLTAIGSCCGGQTVVGSCFGWLTVAVMVGTGVVLLLTALGVICPSGGTGLFPGLCGA